MEETVTLTVNGTEGEYFVECEDDSGTYWVWNVYDWNDPEAPPTEILWSKDDERAEDPVSSPSDFERILDGVLETFIARKESA